MASSIAQDLGIGSLNAGEAAAAASVLSRPADEFGNSADIEMQWAVKAYHHAETYFNLICSIDPKLLRLTPHDNQIYEEFRNLFPDEKVDTIQAEDMKSAKNKEIWRPFCEGYRDVIDEYNFASLIRANCKLDYTEENTFVVPKVQFLAIEIARNREGHNSGLREKYAKKKST